MFWREERMAAGLPVSGTTVAQAAVRRLLHASMLAVLLCLAVPGAAGASNAGWMVTPTPNVGAPTGIGYAESCLPGGACVAVGAHVSRSGLGETLAERWNGRRWRIERTPNPDGVRSSELNAVACF